MTANYHIVSGSASFHPENGPDQVKQIMFPEPLRYGGGVVNFEAPGSYQKALRRIGFIWPSLEEVEYSYTLKATYLYEDMSGIIEGGRLSSSRPSFGDQPTRTPIGVEIKPSWSWHPDPDRGEEYLEANYVNIDFTIGFWSERPYSYLEMITNAPQDRHAKINFKAHYTTTRTYTEVTRSQGNVLLPVHPHTMRLEVEANLPEGQNINDVFDASSPNSLSVNFNPAILSVEGYIPKTEPVTLWIGDTTTIGPMNFTEVNREISTAEDLFNLRYADSDEYELVNDIDLSNFEIPAYHPNHPDFDVSWEWYDTPQGEFPPISDYHLAWPGARFKLNGNGHKIKNFKSTIGSESYTNSTALIDWMGMPPLFFEADRMWAYEDHPGDTPSKDEIQKNLEAPYIKNLTLENVDITTESWRVAALVGHLSSGSINYPTIENCHVTGFLKNTRTTGARRTAGIVCDVSPWFVEPHEVPPAIISRCSFKGTIEGVSIGGIVNDGVVIIRDCYSRADFIDGRDYTGGIVANIWEYEEDNEWYGNFLSEIIGCYTASRFFVPTGTTKRPIAHSQSNRAIIEDCYYDGDLTYISSNKPGVYERTTEEMTYPHNKETTYVGWDLE